MIRTARDLGSDLRALGIAEGDMVMVHAAISSVGELIAGADTLIQALIDVVGAGGTIVGYTDWNENHDDLRAPDGTIPAEWRAHVPPFDPKTSRATRDNGVFPEFLRTMPGACRSGNPGASVAALGARADWLTANHPLDYGYGQDSPFARLVEADGKVAMIGAPLDTMTLLHHAEHLADVPNKHVRRAEVPFAGPNGTTWRMIEEFDTCDPVVDGLPDDYFGTIVREFLGVRTGGVGMVGDAPAVLVGAAAIVPFAVAWIERAVSREADR